MPLTPWAPPSSASLTTAVLFSEPTLAPALVFFFFLLCLATDFLTIILTHCFWISFRFQLKLTLMIYVWFNFVFVGVYVANRASDKITQLTDNVYVCRSGSVLFFLKQLTFIAYGENASILITILGWWFVLLLISFCRRLCDVSIFISLIKDCALIKVRRSSVALPLPLVVTIELSKEKKKKRIVHWIIVLI